MIELVAKARGLTVPAAVRKIAAEGVPLPDDVMTPAVINRYAKEHPGYRKRLDEFWGKAQKYLLRATSRPLAALRSHLRVHTHLPESRWTSGPGHLIGGLPTDVIATFFEPGFMSRKHKGRKLFPGWLWTDALVVPHYNGPDRICGFLFVGRNASPQDFIFRSSGIWNDTLTKEAGLAGVPSLSLCRSPFGEYAIVFDDPFLATRLQIRHAATSNDLLPLLAFHDGLRMRTSYKAYAPLDKHPLFFGFQLTPQIVHQAIWTDGLISVPRMRVEPTPSAIDHYVRDHTPIDLLRNVVATAKPWASFMKDWSKNTSDHIVDELLAGLETYGQPTMEKIAQVHSRLDRVPTAEDRYPSVRFGRFLVYEKDGKTWAIEPKREPIMVINATIRVDKSVVEAGRQLYAGHLTFDGHKLPFALSDKAFCQRDRAQLHLQKLVTTGTKGGVLWIAPGWGGRLLQLATAPYQ